MPKSTAGYSGTPLAKKLGIRAGFVAAVVGAPADYFKLIEDAPEDVQWIEFPLNDADFVHFFAENRSELEHLMPALKNCITRNGMLWVSWRKKSSGVATDLDENIVRELGLYHGLVDVKVCAVDKTWSGLKFVFRIADR